MRSVTAILFWCCCTFTFLYAQSDRLWFFGERAGLEFTESGVTARTDNALSNTYYGGFTLNDDEGDLLLYTNGTGSVLVKPGNDEPGDCPAL